MAATDAYQWGYDPVHYGVPEGSYATDPDGPARILEYRCLTTAGLFCPLQLPTTEQDWLGSRKFVG